MTLIKVVVKIVGFRVTLSHYLDLWGAATLYIIKMVCTDVTPGYKEPLTCCRSTSSLNKNINHIPKLSVWILF